MAKYFESIRCEDYEIFNLDYHEQRISRTIGLNVCLQDYIYPLSNKLLRCKVIYDESGVLSVDFYPYEKRDIKSFKIVVDDKISYEKKYLNRQNLDELFSLRDDCDEIIVIKNGLVTDTSIANIAIYLDGIWMTPKKPILNGTTRQRYLEKKEIIEKDISIEMLKKAQKLALMNAMIGFDIKKEFIFK